MKAVAGEEIELVIEITQHSYFFWKLRRIKIRNHGPKKNAFAMEYYGTILQFPFEIWVAGIAFINTGKKKFEKREKAKLIPFFGTFCRESETLTQARNKMVLSGILLYENEVLD